MFPEDRARLELYVDDPIIVTVGDLAFRDNLCATVVALWAILCLGFAFPKAQRGSAVVWVGASIQLLDTGVVLGLKDSCMEVKALTAELGDANVAPLAKLRT